MSTFIRRVLDIPHKRLYLLLVLLGLGLIISMGCFLNVRGRANEVSLSEITPALPPDGCVGRDYTPYHLSAFFDLSALTRPVFGVTDTLDDLPEGLSLDPETGIISGTPEGQTGEDGTTIEIGVWEEEIDEQEPDIKQEFTFHIRDFAIMTSALAKTCVGELEPYDSKVEVCGGTGPYTWELVGENYGLAFMDDDDLAEEGSQTIEPENRVGGTPDSSGTHTITVHVTDIYGLEREKELELEVTDELTVLSPRNLSHAFLNTPYEETLRACGGTPDYTWTLDEDTQLPNDLSFSTEEDQGQISGLINETEAIGVHPFSVEVSDDDSQTKSADFNITVIGAPLLVATSVAPILQCENNVSDLNTVLSLSGGMGERHWALRADASLPYDWQLEDNGILTADHPPTLGEYTVPVTVTDTVDSLHFDLEILVVKYPPDDADLVINRFRQGGVPGDENNVIILANEDRLIRVIFTITDATLSGEWDMASVREVALSRIGPIGLCSEVTTEEIIDMDDPGQYRARFDVNPDILDLVSEPGDYQFRVELRIGSQRDRFLVQSHDEGEFVEIRRE